MKLIDVHAHIQQHDPAELAGIIERAEAANVGAIIAAGVTVQDSGRCVEIAHERPSLFAGVGVHPTDLTGWLTATDLSQLERAAADDRVVVMSEIGIDHQEHVLARPRPGSAGDGDWRDVQSEAFKSQIEIARRQGLPIVFHVREPGDDPEAGSAWPAALRDLKDTTAGEISGAAHYFQGNQAAADALVDAGLKVSFGRPLSRFKRLREIARRLPIESILVETDSYPQPFKKDRGKWTEPRHLKEVAECLAVVRGVSLEEITERTSENALAMLRDRHGAVRARLR